MIQNVPGILDLQEGYLGIKATVPAHKWDINIFEYFKILEINALYNFRPTITYQTAVSYNDVNFLRYWFKILI